MTILNDLCELIVDCEHRTAPPAPDGYPLIRTPDIGHGRLMVDSALRVDEETYRNWTRRAAPQPGDLILAREAPVGNVGIVPPGVHPVLGQRTVLIRPTADALDPKYLNYFLSSPRVRGWMDGVASGATVPHLNLSDIRALDLRDLPPIGAQRRIGAALSAYDDLIENNNRRIKILEEMAQRIYREWFVDFRYPGHEGVPLADSAVGPIPTEWALMRIDDCCAVVLGGTPSRSIPEYWTDGTVPWCNSGLVNELRVIAPSELITEEALKRSATKMMPKGTTLIAITGATLGQVSLLEIDACANQSVVGVIPQTTPQREYLYLYVTEMIGEIIGAASGGAQQHINKAVVSERLITVPPHALEERFRTHVGPLFDEIGILLWAIASLRDARDLLLPRLISGEIDVTDLDIAMPEAV